LQERVAVARASIAAGLRTDSGDKAMAVAKMVSSALVSSPLRKTSTGGSPICDASTTPRTIASTAFFRVCRRSRLERARTR
jgi:hypothetical protein